MGKSSVAPLEMVVRHAYGLVRELVDHGVMNASLINVKGDFVVWEEIECVYNRIMVIGLVLGGHGLRF